MRVQQPTPTPVPIAIPEGIPMHRHHATGLLPPPDAPTPAPYVKPTPSAAPIPISSSKCPPSEGFTSGVSYVRFRAPRRGDNYLQISQVLVNDRSGTNIALKKPATATTPHAGSTGPGNQVVQAAWAVDGIIKNKWGWPNDKVMINENQLDSWWMVDLQGEFDVKEVYYYNRAGWTYRAVGVVVELLDVQKNVIKHYVMQNDQQIYCIPTN